MRTFAMKKPVPMSGDTGQLPFPRVAPLLATALVLGASGGFALAAILTLARLLHVREGAWWPTLAQAHGHMQLYGWAGLFVLGVAFHFVPRLRGAPLAGGRYVLLILICQASGIVLRSVSQPLVALTGAEGWRALLMLSGGLELLGLGGAVALLAATLMRGPALATRKAFVAVAPFFALALAALLVAAVVNLVNVMRAATLPIGLVPGPADALNVTLGLLGFLIPVALAMSAQALPMYAGLTGFPRQVLWPVAGAYGLGLVLVCVATAASGEGAWSRPVGGLGALLLGGALLVFLAVCIRLMRMRGKLPNKVATLAPKPEEAARQYRRQVADQRVTFGPFVALIGSAYTWALVGGALLVVDGAAGLLGASPIFGADAMRHAFAVGFIAMLIGGIAPRMLPGFSGGMIRSASLVTATLWLGNTAALLRVGSILLQPLLGAGNPVTQGMFGLSGPVGLAFAIVLVVNLWPAILTDAEPPMR